MKVSAQPARNALGKSQPSQQVQYNHTVKPLEFEAGQKVLLPKLENKLLMCWHSPFEVVQRVGSVNFEVKLANQQIKLFHVNLLKAWVSEEEVAAVHMRS